MNHVDNKLWSETIQFLRFPLIVGVIFIHTDITLPNNESIEDSSIWTVVENIMYLFSYVLPAACVPLFFFISGFLFFKNVDFNLDVYKRKILSRCRTLLAPYVIWNLLGFLLFLLKHYNSFKDGKLCVTFVGFLNGFFMIHPSNTNPPFNFPLWFIRDLIILVVLSPLIFLLIKKMRIMFVIFLGIYMLWSLLASLEQVISLYSFSL